MMILGVLVLEGPVDLDQLERVLANRLSRIPRFRQCVVKTAKGHVWLDDPHFVASSHIERVKLPGRDGKAALEDFVSALSCQPLSMVRPLWHFHVVEDYEGGAALVGRIHHAIGDGTALVRVMLSLTEPGPILRPDDLAVAAPARPAALPKKEAAPSPFAVMTQAMGIGFDSYAALLKGYTEGSAALMKAYLSLVGHPAKALDYARQGSGISAELSHLLFMEEDSPTRFKGPLSGRKRVAWTERLPLEEIKAVSKAFDCSVNDLLLAAVTRSLKGYLEDKGDPTEGVEVRAVIPVDLRPKERVEDLGNWFGMVAVELPVGIEDPMLCLSEVTLRMAALKSSFEPPVTLGLVSALGMAPKTVQDKFFDFLLSRMTAVMTNVPGPQHPLYLGGARLGQIMFWVPQSGSIGMGVSILSFDGHVQFGLITDAALVPDPHAIIDRFALEFEAYLYRALLAA